MATSPTARLLVSTRNQLGENPLWDAARHSVDAVRDGVADICFLAVDPVRANELAFTSASGRGLGRPLPRPSRRMPRPWPRRATKLWN